MNPIHAYIMTFGLFIIPVCNTVPPLSKIFFKKHKLLCYPDYDNNQTQQNSLCPSMIEPF